MFGDLQDNRKISEAEKIRADVAAETLGVIGALQHCRRAMDERQPLIISDRYILLMDPTVSWKRRSCYLRIWVILGVPEV